jgi:pyruvate/2-oxoacid:ferredoxin oxidoreductase alpha subunit
VDQGDSLALRDAAMLQFYTESHQELVDTILLAFRVAEDPRVLLPALVAFDGFVTSHTQMVVDLPEQELVDRFLPPLNLPHRLQTDHPVTIGGLTWPRETEHDRHEIERAMQRVPAVLHEALAEFEKTFGRRPAGPMQPYRCEDAETVLVASNTMARTAGRVADRRRDDGQRVGVVAAKLFRPFPRQAVIEAIGPAARRVGVLDRNHSPGSGGIFWQEVVASLRSRPDVLVQDYLVGLGGGDVTPQIIHEIVDDLTARQTADEPCFKEVGV